MLDINVMQFFWQLVEQVLSLAPQIIDFFLTDSIISGVSTWVLILGTGTLLAVIRGVLF